MTITLHRDVAAFAALVRPLLDADPIRHTIALTALTGLVQTGEAPAVLATVHEAGVLVGAALRTPSRPVILSALPARCAPAMDRALADADPELPGAVGPAAEVAAFVAARRARTGAPAEVRFRMRLFALDGLRPPAAVPGIPRLAGPADLDVLATWRLDFAREALGGWRDPDTPRESARRSIGLGHAQVLWEVAREPVAWAAAGLPVAGASRIGPVYTPPAHRARGYGSAVTAAASEWALDAGARDVVLFTDLANPVSNAIYPRLGYRPVCDGVEVRFPAR